ncbi:MAG TPA: hypothetical protein VIK72_12595 [Clostridiaceae bacterium]
MLNKRNVIVYVLLTVLVLSIPTIYFISKAMDKGSNKAKEIYKKKYIYTINVFDPASYSLDPRVKYLEDKFNIEFKLIPVNFNDWDDKVRILISSGQTPDIVWSRFQNQTVYEVERWVKEGVFRELPDINIYPNLFKLKVKMASDEALKINGKDYIWTSSIGNKSIKDINLCMYFYRKDWAEKLGLSKEEYTWEEFKNLIKEIVAKDPGENGKGNTIGLTTIGWGYPGFVTTYFPTPGYTTGGYRLSNGKYIWAASAPETLKGIKELKIMYDQNIIWKEQPYAKNDDGPNKFYSGQAAALYNNWIPLNINAARENLKKTDPNIDVNKAVAPLYVRNPDGDLIVNENGDYWSAVLLKANMEDEKADRLFKMWDWIASAEGYKFSTLGIEGKDWNENGGIIKLLWKKDVYGNYISPYKGEGYRIMQMVSYWHYFDLTDNQMFPVEVRNQAMAVTSRMLSNDVKMLKRDYGADFFSGPNIEKIGTLTIGQNTEINNLLVNSNNIEKDWKAWVNSKLPTIQPVLDELNKGLLNK